MRSLLLAVFAFTSVSSGAEWDALKLTFHPKPESGGYYDMPWNVKEATALGKWEKIDEDKNINVDVYSQHGDPRVMLLFDKKGNIAGIRVGFLKEDVAAKAKSGGYKFEFEYDNNPMYEINKYLGKEMWTATVLFASPATLASGGRNKLARASDNIAEGVYFKSNGKWTELSRDECKQNFAEGNCYPGMGKHYFYSQADNGDCKRAQPFFTLYNNGRLSGVGISGYGSFSKSPSTQSFFEDVDPNSVKKILTPESPKCVEEYVKKFGLTRVHVYLTKDAPKISCPKTSWRSAHC